MCMVEGRGSVRKGEEGRREEERRGEEKGGEGGGKGGVRREEERRGEERREEEWSRRLGKVGRFCITGLYSGILQYTVHLLQVQNVWLDGEIKLFS